MKSKLSWITFVPLLLAAGFLRAAQWIFPEGALFNLSNLYLNYIFIGAVLLVFLFTCLFCVIDRSISLYYIPHRNFVAFFFGLLLALAFAADGAFAFYGMFSSGKIEVLPVIEASMLMLSAVVFVVMGLSHAMKTSPEGKKLSLINVIPALLCAVRMIMIFVSFTTTSLKIADIVPLFCYIFATMFFFNYSIVLSLTKTKHAVKSCMIFGFPAAAAMLSYGIVKLVFEFNVIEPLKNLEGAEAALIGLYILSFLIELTAFVKNRNNVTVIYEEDEVVEVKEIDAKSDGYVTGKTDQEEDDRDSYYITSTDTSDYLVKETKTDDDHSDYISHNEIEAESYLTQIEEDYDKDPDRPSDYYSRIDEIDKLILEIIEQTD